MKKQIHAFFCHILILSIMIGSAVPLYAADRAQMAAQEKRSFFQAITDFKNLYQKCKKPGACTLEEQKKLQSQKDTIIAVGTGLVLLVAGGTALGIFTYKYRKSRAQKEELKRLEREAEERNRLEQEALQRRQQEELERAQREKTEKEQQELRARQEEERRRLAEEQRKRDEEERLRREEQERQRIEQERIEKAQREEQERIAKEQEEIRRKQEEEAARIRREQEARLKAEQDELEKIRKREEQVRIQREAARQRKMNQLVQKLKKELPLRVSARGFYNKPKEVRQQLSTEMGNRIRQIESAYQNQDYATAINLLIEGFDIIGTSDKDKKRLGISPKDLQEFEVE